MAVTKWDGAWTDRGTVLGAELNALASNGVSVAGTEVANQTNLDMTGQLEIAVTFPVAPAMGAVFIIYMSTAPDGTNYETSSRVAAILPVPGVTTLQRLKSPVFLMEPTKTKFVLVNQTSQALPASGSAVKLFTQNAETA